MKKYFVCLLVLFSSIFSFAQEAAKKEESPKPMSCPEPYKCIEISFETGLLMSSLPIDQPVILYGKNVEKFEEGSFKIVEKIKNGKEELVYRGPIQFDEKKETLNVVINRYLRSNREYRIFFETSASKAVKEVATKAIIDFYISINTTYDSTQGISFQTVENLRKLMIEKLPSNFSKNINSAGIFNGGSSYFLKPDDINLMNQTGNNSRLLKNIETKSVDIKNKLKSLFNAAILEIIQKRNSQDLYTNLLLLNEDAILLNNVSRGLSTFKDPTTPLAPPTIYKLNETDLKQIVKTIDKNVNIIQGWKQDNAFSIYPAAISEIDLILADFDILKARYISLIDNIPVSMILTNNSLNSALVEFIVNSIIIEGNTISDLLTSAQLYTGADIGVLLTNLSSTPDSWRTLPYLGLNLYFLPVNKRAPITMLLKEYNPWIAFWKVTSVHFGITIPKIDSPQYQGIYEFENARGIFCGVGIRPWRSIRLSTGKMFINRSVANSLNNTFNISARNYFSISIDWEVRKIIPNIKELFSQ